jgi:protein ImuB
MGNISSRRYLSLWLRRLATDRLTRQSRLPIDRPLALIGAVKNARALTAVNDAAARMGLRVGMSFADACAILPALDWAEQAPAEDARLLARLADWCERYTPLVGLDAPDGLMLDITGVVHLFGGESALARDLVQRLAEFGLNARIGVAETVGAAWAAARHGKNTIIPSSETHKALAGLPLAALRLLPETREGLSQLGLRTIGDIMVRPRAGLAARFGAELMRRLDQALGREEEPISPRTPLPAFSVEQGFPEPLLRDEDLLSVLAWLEKRLCALLEERGEGARRVLACFFGVDGKVNRLEIGASRPLRDAAHLHRLFTDKFALVQWDSEFGFDRIRVAVLEAERVSPAQKDFAAREDGPGLTHLIDRLSARLGEARVLRFFPQDSHVPEHASIAIPAASAKEFAPKSPAPIPPTPNARACNSFAVADRPSTPRWGRGTLRFTSPLWGGRNAKRSGWGDQSAQDTHQDSLSPARPLRLFERPEPIETIAEIPDGPPVKFRWRRVAHEVARVEGPERIALPWWGGTPSPERGEAILTRDYFRVETAGGARLWLYREGLYGETSRPRWFCHGFLP